MHFSLTPKSSPYCISKYVPGLFFSFYLHRPYPNSIILPPFDCLIRNVKQEFFIVKENRRVDSLFNVWKHLSMNEKDRLSS